MRECGDCTACCTKVLIVPNYTENDGVYCEHCEIKKGCKIYKTRPEMCVDFECLWYKQEQIPDEYRPDKIGVMFENPAGTLIYFGTVDPAKKDLWKKNYKVGIMVKKIKESGHPVFIEGNAFLPEGMSKETFSEMLKECQQIYRGVDDKWQLQQ